MLLWLSLPDAIFSSDEAEGAPCNIATQATDNAVGGKMAPALRVAFEKTPLRVARRLFGTTKLLSSRLDWRFFKSNSVHHNNISRP